MHFSVFHMYLFVSSFGLTKIQKCIITIIERRKIAKSSRGLQGFKITVKKKTLTKLLTELQR